MPQPPIDPALNAFALGMMVLSLTACMHVLAMRQKGVVLPYERRQPVPWGPVGCVLAATLLLFVAISAIGGDSAGVPIVVDGKTPKAPSSVGLISGMFTQFGIVVAFLFFVASFSKATPRDLGLSANRQKNIRDVFIGSAACLAALAPVHIVQIAMMYMFFSEQAEPGHPIIKLVLSAPDPTLLILTGVATVIVAPVCEEITFRVLLQGWLERWEDEQLGWRKPAIVTPPLSHEVQSANDAQVHSEQQSFDAVPSLPESATASFDDSPSLPDVDPPQRGVFGLSYGWFPILISSAAFGLAHYGYGPEPVPIFILGMVLGFVYQRTHRLLPGIVTHALFNLFTLIILWRMVYHHS